MPVELRKFTPDDTKALSRVLNNKNVMRNLRDGIPFPYTANDASAYIRMVNSDNPDNTFVYAIVYDGKLIGNIGAFRQGNIHFRTAELGYYLAEEYWNMGIMTEAVGQFCRALFDKTDILRIFAEPFCRNTGSVRVLQKNGFKKEGVLRKAAQKDGIVLDIALLALIKENENGL